MSAIDEYFPTDEQVEARGVTHALVLLAAAAEPKAAKARLDQINKATAEHTAQRAAAEKIVAEASAKQEATDAASADLVKRTADFQSWSNVTERAYREREERIRQNEEAGARREAALAAAEDDLARRVAAHDRRLQSLKESLS